ncbi:hypothetical protein BaRGS_00038807 [Batillaria attramentaria]|uniref:Uncharacterized protein n=1 Tax=Batillaria attramentaria TaxID=370345 RepID=A0ABD0J5Q4_9CAEN
MAVTVIITQPSVMAVKGIITQPSVMAVTGIITQPSVMTDRYHYATKCHGCLMAVISMHPLDVCLGQLSSCNTAPFRPHGGCHLCGKIFNGDTSLEYRGKLGRTSNDHGV